MPEKKLRAMVRADLTRLSFIGDPAISPDGRRIAFVLTTLSEEKDQYLSAIWIADTAGGEPRRFTAGPKRDTSPRWSPDGRRLAFLSERDGKKKAQLYVMAADGGEPIRLTDIKAGVSDPAWSADGRRLAFVSRVGGWEEPDDPEEKEKSKPARVITTLKHKMNGEGFVYDRRPHVFVVDADGGAPRQITDGDFADATPAWSPDSSLIAFTSARHDDRDHDNRADVWVVSPDGGEPRRVTDTAGPVACPAFSPDGGTIAFFGARHVNEAGRNMRLYTVPVGGGTTACLTPSLDRTCVPFSGNIGPAWTGDGESILFGVEDQGDVPLYRARKTGGEPERIVTGSRQVSGLSVSRHGATAAFTATAATSPGELFVCRADGTNERRLFDPNAAWKDEVWVSPPERFRYTRAGLTLDAWVMKPFAFETGQRYPALLNIHGGPHTQYGHNFFDEFQIQAAAGYVVVFTNPRGSQGYGEAFTRAVVGDWGGGDYEDVMAGLDEALRRCDFIDPARLGVLGGSYGGYLTSWIVGHTSRFAAACSERAVNDYDSMFGTSDIGHYFQEWESGGRTPWDHPDWYRGRSPLTYAKNITTPLLIIHSEDDLRCPMEQAEQLFTALKKFRKEVVFVRFPDENHELSRSGRPRHRLARFGFILDWFGKHLGVPQDR
jgi:dipeptidyl aminopeptidase/acylaminoacyl peptidase